MDPLERWIAGIVITTCVGIFSVAAWAIVHEVNEPLSGTVTELEYDPPHATVTCVQSGKTTVCTPTTTAACWRVVYDNGDDWGDACLPEDQFRLYRVGDHYPKER